MAVRDILVCIDPTAAANVRLRLAVNLARANKAYLTAGYVMPQDRGSGIPVNPGPGIIVAPEMLTASGGPGVQQVSREAERAESVEQLFRSELRLHGIDGEWHLLSPGETAALIDRAKSVDLTILGQLSPDPGSHGFRPEDVVLLAGRPILVVPYAGTFETAGSRVLIAWDGTREAVRALNDALPLIGNADAVTVMFVGSDAASIERQRPALERILDHLRRHGIAAKPEEALHDDIAISDVLLSRAADLAADLIVTGGFHHSQLREALLGGVSRELLEHMTVPVLMSH